jgi:hypothetical protein
MKNLLLITLFVLFSLISAAQHLKKDGTPDMRYKENRHPAHVSQKAQMYLACGIERWAIKTLSDNDSAAIDFTDTLESTVSMQRQLQRPLGPFNKRGETECTLVKIKCNLIGFKREEDNDLHIVVEDRNTGETMVVEVANPDCDAVRHSCRFQQLQGMYTWFITTFGEGHKKMHRLLNPQPIVLIGTGYWDFIHGQTGMAPNGREIHPVLAMALDQ